MQAGISRACVIEKIWLSELGQYHCLNGGAFRHRDCNEKLAASSSGKYRQGRSSGTLNARPEFRKIAARGGRAVARWCAAPKCAGDR